MINPVNSLSSAHAMGAIQQQNSQTPPVAQQPKQEPPQDTVQLSQAALAAVKGDVDHDGDSR